METVKGEIVMFHKLLMVLVFALFLASCASGASEETPVATAEISVNGETPSDEIVVDGEVTAEGDATTEGEPAVEATAVTPDPAAVAISDASAVTTSFLAAYQGENDGAAAAQYFDASLTELLNNGNTVRAVAGIDPTYTNATITNAAPYNDDKTMQVNVQLDYAGGAQKIIVTLKSTEAGWRIATFAADAQK
jgi:hypothetical protein